MIFVDASALYALGTDDDRWHAQAHQIAGQLPPPELVTTDLVLAETWFLAYSRRGRYRAMRQWEAIRRGNARVEFMRSADLDRAWQIAQEFADQDFSFVDCTSFAFIERYGIRQAFSFDRDFTVFRYGPRRTIALEVLGLTTE